MWQLWHDTSLSLYIYQCEAIIILQLTYFNCVACRYVTSWCHHFYTRNNCYNSYCKSSLWSILTFVFTTKHSLSALLECGCTIAFMFMSPHMYFLLCIFWGDQLAWCLNVDVYVTCLQSCFKCSSKQNSLCKVPWFMSLSIG